MVEYPICLTLTRPTKRGEVPVTDKWAIVYAAKKLGVPEDQIELVRDSTIIKLRAVNPDEEEVEFLSFDNWIYETFGFPDENDKHYKTFKQFGYSNWLIKTYPEEFAYDGASLIAIRQSLELEYQWYRLETFFGIDGEAPQNVLEELFLGSDIVYPKSEIAFELPLKIAVECPGFLLWSEDLGEFVVFLTEDDEYVPMLVKPSQIENSGEVFDGWDES